MKTKPRALDAIARAVLLICTPPVLLLANLYLLATPAFVRYEYNKPGFPPADLYDSRERLLLAEATVHYMRSSKGTDYLMQLQSRGLPVYNSREIIHLADAKRVMNAALGVHSICLILCLLALVYAHGHPKRWYHAWRAISWAGLFLFVLLASIGLLAYVNFNLFFTTFHRLLFTGDSWLFPFSDTLIQLFPLPFWMDATWLICLLTLMESAIVGWAAYAFSRRLRARQQISVQA
ncbi:MAG: TIGR01906 family membrane protein [Chloroflexi bacterium]|nr:TIGR01906 family membrane protein [Chloroflexota bacterium]